MISQMTWNNAMFAASNSLSNRNNLDLFFIFTNDIHEYIACAHIAPCFTRTCSSLTRYGLNLC